MEIATLATLAVHCPLDVIMMLIAVAIGQSRH
jgi:hypothetical protein